MRNAAPHHARPASGWPLLALALALLLGGCTSEADPETEQQAERVPEVPVRHVVFRNVDTERTYTGRVHGSREVNVRARVSGIIHSREYSEGALVEAGQVLFQIDPTRYQVQVQRSEAEVARAEAEVRQAEREWERVSDLYDDDAISGRERDAALSELELAQAGLALAEAELANTRLELDYATVEAPVTGVAGLEEHPEGSLIDPGTLLTRLVQLDPVHIRFSIPEGHMHLFGVQIRSGGGYVLQLILPDGDVYPMAGRIDFTEAGVDSETGTVRARAVFPNPDQRLVPGQFVRIRLEGLHLGWGAEVPHRAVGESRDGPIVYVVDADDQVESRQVRLVHDLGTAFMVTEGLEEGDRLVVDGLSSLRDGRKVTPIEDEDAPDEGETPRVLGVLQPAQTPLDTDTDTDTDADADADGGDEDEAA